MVRHSFIKSLDIDGDNKMTVKAWLVEIFWYNRPMIFFRRLGIFIQRLPKWLKLCWKTENWDYESIYDFIEMQLKEMKKAQEKDTWHAPHNVKRAIQQIKCTLAHLDRYISISENKKYIKKIVKMPLVVQINAGSVLDSKRKKKTYSLIKKCDKIVLGSDCHNITSRKPNLANCRNLLSDDLGERAVSNIDIFSEEFLYNGGK